MLGNLLMLSILAVLIVQIIYVAFNYRQRPSQKTLKTPISLVTISTRVSEILSSDGELEELFEQVAQECVPMLGVGECIIYLYNHQKGVLAPAMARRIKEGESNEALNRREILPGVGIIGQCFATANSIYSEETNHLLAPVTHSLGLSTPIMSNGKVVGVATIKGTKRAVIKKFHTQALCVVAALCGVRFASYPSKKFVGVGHGIEEDLIKMKSTYVKKEVRPMSVTSYVHAIEKEWFKELKAMRKGELPELFFANSELEVSDEVKRKVLRYFILGKAYRKNEAYAGFVSIPDYMDIVDEETRVLAFPEIHNTADKIISHNSSSEEDSRPSLDGYKRSKQVKETFRHSYLNRGTGSKRLNAKTVSKDGREKVLKAAVDYVKANLGNSEMTIQSMAQALGLGRNQLQKEIKALTALTPVEFVRFIRLVEARKLLKNRKHNVSEVAFHVGFNNLSYFTRSFKAEFGLLPSECREF